MEIPVQEPEPPGSTSLRDLHGERNKEPQKKPGRRTRKILDLAVVDRGLDADKVKCAGLRVKPQNCRQHEHRRNHRVQKEFHRSIHASFVPIHTNQQSHRDQRGFPEEVKEEQIKRDENPDQRGLQH